MNWKKLLDSRIWLFCLLLRKDCKDAYTRSHKPLIVIVAVGAVIAAVALLMSGGDEEKILEKPQVVKESKVIGDYSAFGQKIQKVSPEKKSHITAEEKRLPGKILSGELQADFYRFVVEYYYIDGIPADQVRSSYYKNDFIQFDPEYRGRQTLTFDGDELFEDKEEKAFVEKAKELGANFVYIQDFEHIQY